MTYKIYIKPSASKDLDILPDKEAQRVLYHIAQLQYEPRPVGVQKLVGDSGFRIRSGKYRIIFEINDKVKAISVYRIKHRKDVYRK